jgi:hypothetical protein
VLAPLTLKPLANDDEDYPTFLADRFEEMASYVVDRVPVSGIADLVIEPAHADLRPGRRVLYAGSPLCRIIGDPSDPRPLNAVARALIEAEVRART